MRFFLTSLFALLFISGSSLKTTKGLKPINSSLTQVENVYFSDESKPYVYRVSMMIYGKNQSGILIIKRMVGFISLTLLQMEKVPVQILHLCAQKLVITL